MPNLKIYTLPKAGLNGHLYVTEVEDGDPADKNDKGLLFVFDGNVTGFTLDKIVLSALDDSDTDISDEVSFVSETLIGRDGGAVYTVDFRPPMGGGDGSITITVIADAVAEGNAETALTVTYSDDFPKSEWQPLFSADDEGDTYDQIVSIDSEKVYLRHDAEIHVYDWDGVQDTDATVALTEAGAALRLNADTYLARDSLRLVGEQGGVRWESADIFEGTLAADMQSVALTKDGRLLVASNANSVRKIRQIPIEDVHVGILTDSDLSDKTYEDITPSDDDLDNLPNNTWYLASDLNNLYLEPRSTGDRYIRAYDTKYGAIPEKRIPMASDFINYATLSLFVFGNLLFRYDTDNSLQYIDLTPWQIPQPLGKIYPQAVSPGDRIDLRNFVKSTSEITFDVGFKIPEWLSLQEDRYLVVADDAEASETSYLRLRGINHVGASPLHGCMFYLHVGASERETPTWYNIEKLSIRDDQEINLFEFVRNADTLEAVYGNPLPDFLELENGILRVVGDGTSANLTLRAGTHNGFFSDKAITLTIIPRLEDVSILNVIDYTVEIEGIDVSDHLVRDNFPSINNSLDWVKLNEFKRGRCSVSLYSNADNAGHFNDTNPSSFWAAHTLNKSGYLNAISVFVLLEKSDGSSQRILIFEGVIFDADDALNAGQIRLLCYDPSYILKDSQLQESIRGIEKVLELTPSQSSEDPTVEGVYRLEGTAGEMIPTRAQAWNDTQQLTLKETANRVDGATENNTAIAANTGILTEGGYLHDDVETPLLASVETPHRYVSVASAVEKYLKTENPKLTTHIQEMEAEGDVHIRANGNLAFATEKGRILKHLSDWVVDTDTAKLYYLLSHPVNHIQDELVCRDLKTGTSQVLYRFDPQLATLKLATSDFDTFEVMLRDATDFDWSAETLEIQRKVKEDLDAGTSEKTRIVSYQHSEKLYKTVVEKDTDYRPLCALHYWTGVGAKDFDWAGISEGDRGTFNSENNVLRYRYAKENDFGVVRLAADGTLTELFNETKDGYFNHLNFTFEGVGSDTYFAFVSGSETGSTLTIKKRSGGNTTTIFSRTLDFRHLKDLDSTGNAWLGVHEMLVDGNHNFYLIVPVSRNGRDIATGAGVILYRYSIVTQQLTVVLKKDFVQHGMSMLTKFEGQVYFAESPAVTAEYPAINRSVAYRASEAKGFLYCIRSLDGSAEKIGNVYFDGGSAYNAQPPVKGLVFDGDLNFIAGHGDARAIRLNSSGSSPENFQWFSFGKGYRYKLPLLKKEGAILGALTELAVRTNSTLSIDKSIVSIENRQPRGAVTAVPTNISDTTIAYEFANDAFPESGYLLIDEEVIKYTEKTDTQFTTVTRGELATDAQDHAAGDLITFVDRIIEDTEKINSTEPYLQVTVSLDSAHLFNSISAGSGQILLKDEPSQAKFRESELPLNFGTTPHEIPFATFIADQYLQRLKNLEYVINARVRAFFSIRPGEVVCFKFLRDADDVNGYLTAMQVMSVQTDAQFTTLRGRHVTPSLTPVEKPDISGLRVTDGGGSTFFADGAGAIAGWYGDPRYIDTSPIFDVEALDALKLTQYGEMVPVVLPEAKSPIGNPIAYSLSPALGDGLVFNSQTRTLRGAPNGIQGETDYTYTATDLETGETATRTQSIEVLRGIRDERPVLDGGGSAFFTDGAENITGWYGH